MRAALANLRYERARRAQQISARGGAATAHDTTANKRGEWGPEHMEWLDSLLSDDVERVKRHVGVLGFE